MLFNDGSSPHTLNISQPARANFVQSLLASILLGAAVAHWNSMCNIGLLELIDVYPCEVLSKKVLEVQAQGFNTKLPLESKFHHCQLFATSINTDNVYV